MILPLLISLIALNLVQAKHFLVETEDNKDEDNKNKDNNLIQLKGKNNTNILTRLYKEFNQVPIFSLYTLTNLIYAETKATQKVQ